MPQTAEIFDRVMIENKGLRRGDVRTPPRHCTALAADRSFHADRLVSQSGDE